MIFISGLVMFLLMAFLRILTYRDDAARGPAYSQDENVTIIDLLSDSVIKSWSADLLTAKDPALRLQEEGALTPKTTAGRKQDTYHSINTLLDTRINDSRQNKVKGDLTRGDYTSGHQHQGDDPSAIPSEISLIDGLFEVPRVDIKPDWKVVLGNFEHFDDDNWNDFLIKTEVPYFVRLLLKDSSETVEIKKIQNKNQETGSASKVPKSATKGTEMSIATSSWLASQTSLFTLGHTYNERDFDGTDSKNTFFFVAPRLLVHNKIKDKWRAAIIRHFDEKGLNMTFIDRDRKAVARRFFHRIDD